MTNRPVDLNSSKLDITPESLEIAVAWKINSEIILLFGWGRAILMQIAHPKVAAGVWEHSLFASHPNLRLYRFYQTLNSMLQLMFGTSQEAAIATRNILTIHDRVHGYIREDVGPFPAHTSYTAHDPELLTWVHATLLDSFLLTYERFIGPLTFEEKDAYCRAASRLTVRLGVSQDSLPQSLQELQDYVEDMLSNGQLTVSRDARALAAGVLAPPLPLVLLPAQWAMRSVTIDMLPSELRQQYGLSASLRTRRTLKTLTAATSAVLPLLPWRLRKWPKALRPRASTL